MSFCRAVHTSRPGRTATAPTTFISTRTKNSNTASCIIDDTGAAFLYKCVKESRTLKCCYSAALERFPHSANAISCRLMQKPLHAEIHERR